MKYLDLTGLGEVWANIKSYISSKIPTKTSQLQNDSNYATTSQLPSKTSQLTNDSGFTTIADTVLKTNTDYTFRNYALNSLNIDEKYNENYVVGISEDGYGTRPVGGWTNIINFCTYHFITQLCIPIHPNKDTDCMYIRTRWANDTTWGEWRKSANDNSVVHKSGNETINGVKTFTSEIVNTSPHFRHIYGNYGTFWRQDGVNLYLLLTNSGDPYGDWNNFRPLTVNLATGICDISGTAGGVAWANVSGRPTKVSQFANDSGYLTSGNVVDRTSNQSINGEKTFNYAILTNGGLYTKADINLRIQNIDNIETNPTNQIGSSGIGFTNKDASAWLAYNRYFRTTVDGTAFLQLYCAPIKKSDGSYTTGGYINIYNTGVARVNDPLSIDPNATWNNNNIVTSNWVRKYFSNSIGDYWSKSATGNQYSRSTFSYLSTIDKATTNTSWSIYRPFRIVDKDNSIELGCVEYGYKSDLAYIRLLSKHNKGGVSDLTIHNNGISYFDNCRELWLVDKTFSYNTTPSSQLATKIWFMDKNSNQYATLQNNYYPNGERLFSLTHKSLRTNTWIGLNMITSPTDDVVACQPRFQAKESLSVFDGTNIHNFVNISKGWIEMSHPNYCYIDFKHEGSQDYLGRIGLNPNNILFLETINGAPIMANGKNIVRSVNGVNADNNGNVSIQNSSLPIGSYIQFAGSQAPSGFLVCNGGAISRTTYANLFAVIGTTYGSGDGSTTFNLPNLTDRFLQGSTRVGTVEYAGLPNIMGTINIGTVDNAPESYSNGALSMVSVGDRGYQRAGGVRTLRSISFDASNYNRAYGNSSTIQPPALTCLICIKY